MRANEGPRMTQHRPPRTLASAPTTTTTTIKEKAAIAPDLDWRASPLYTQSIKADTYAIIISTHKRLAGD